MKHISRRGLLAAGTSLTAVSAGCLDQLSNDGTDDSAEPDESDGTELSPLERWVPASGSSELLFHYRDLTAVRQYEDAMRADAVESVPVLPDGESSEFIERATDGEPVVDSVCRFGSKGVVVSGSFDPSAVDADLESAAGDFEIFEREDVSVAVSEGTVVVSPSDCADLEAILAAGVEGVDRRIDAHGNFAQLAERIGDSTFLWGEYEGSGDGTGIALSWALDAETATSRTIAVYADADGTDKFEDTLTGQSADMTVETDGNVGVATKAIPTEEYEYQDVFAERGSRRTEPYAGISIDTDRKQNAAVVMLHSSGTADRVEVRDESGVRAELTEVGQAETIEYESGTSATITVVAISGDAENVLVTESVTF